MSSLSKLKRVSVLLLTAALIVIPNTDFSIKVSSAETTVYNIYDSAALDLPILSTDAAEAAESMARAETVDRAKAEAEKQIEEAKAKAKAEAEAKAKEEAEAKAKAEAEAEAKAKAEAEAKAKAEEEEQARAEAEAKAKAEEEAKAKAEAAELLAVSYQAQTDAGFLLAINNPDPNYTGCAVSVTGYDRDVLERLVMGEAGNQGFYGMALVAQSIRDTLVYDGYSSVDSVRVNCGYYGSLSVAPSAEARAAVAYIFDQGGSAVQHTIRYFYAYTWSSSSWHETMNHIVTYGDHKFFDKW